MSEEEKEHIEFNLKCIKAIMNNFEDRINEEMQTRVDDVINYISKLQKENQELKKDLAFYKEIAMKGGQ